MTAFNNRVVEEIDSALTTGGQGMYLRERFVEGEDLGNAITNYSKITVKKGTRMGYHQHVGDFEFYYILSGEGHYNDNGTIVECKPDDFFKCADGESHAILADGDSDIEFIALIVKTI